MGSVFRRLWNWLVTKKERNVKPPEPPTKLDWGDGERDDSLGALYDFAARSAKDAIGWYWRRAGTAGRTGRALRMIAIVLTTIGGLIPLLITAGVDISLLWPFSATPMPGQANPQPGQWGYVFLALAGACVVLDRFFGYSSAWIRYVTMATELETGLTNFHLDWAQLNAARAGAPMDTAHAAALLSRLQALLTLVRQKVEAETKTWATEYRSSISELDTRIKAGIEEQRPGGVDLTVVNGEQSHSGVRVLVDGVAVQTITGTKASIRPVFPGNHEISVSGDIGGRPATTSKLITVAAGQIVTEELTLPEP